MARQKQHKHLILTDGKNIFTYCFQPTQRLQPNFETDGIRNFMYTKHNGDNAKLRIFSFIPQRQLIQPNFINHTYHRTKHTNTTWTTKTTTSKLVSPLTQSLCSYKCDNANSGVFKLCNKSANFVHVILPQLVQFIELEKSERLCHTANGKILANGNLCFRVFNLQLEVIDKILFLLFVECMSKLN